MRQADVLVIIPTYNEVNNIALLIQQIYNLKHDFHLLIVDDASPDGTAAIVTQLQTHYIHKLFLLNRGSKQGLGSAYVAGFQFALKKKYKYILTIDADLSHDPKDLVLVYEVLNNSSFDLVIGSRYITRKMNVVNWPVSRILLSYFANLYIRFVTGLPIKDTTSGLVGYRNTLLTTIPLHSIQSIGYVFQVEMKFLAYQYGFSLKEIAITFKNRVRGTSKLSKRIILEAFWKILSIKIKNRSKKRKKSQLSRTTT